MFECVVYDLYSCFVGFDDGNVWVLFGFVFLDLVWSEEEFGVWFGYFDWCVVGFLVCDVDGDVCFEFFGELFVYGVCYVYVVCYVDEGVCFGVYWGYVVVGYDFVVCVEWFDEIDVWWWC